MNKLRRAAARRATLLCCSASIAALLSSVPVISTAAEGAQRGGQLNVALRLTAASLDPLFGNAPGGDRKIYNLFAENLLIQGTDGKYQPVLAESWAIANDGLSIVFKLRQGVKFQDGTVFDAAAVKANLDRLVDPKLNAPGKQYVTDLKSVDVVDAATVRVNLHRRSGVMLAMLAVEPGSMLSPTAMAERGAEFGRRPVGTGPFTISSWSGNEIRAERNPHYWRRSDRGEALPYLDRVNIKVVANSAIRIVELKSGNTHLADYLGAKDFQQIEGNNDLAMLPGATAVAQLLSFNIKRPPFDNENLRKAVALSIDRRAISQVIAKGVGEPLAGLEPPGTWVFDKGVRGHDLQLDQARELYKASGHRGPIVLSAIQRDPDTQIAQLVQSMLKRTGIEIKIEMMERQAWLAKILPHQYELGLLQFGVLRADPDVSYSDFFGEKAARNYSGVDTTKVLAPLVASAREQSDIDARRRIYSQIQQTVLDDYQLSPLFWQPMRDAASRRLRGFEREASTSWHYHGLWLQP